MLMVEAQMNMAGLYQHACILGNNVSVEIKISRHSLMVFEVCKHFQLLVYEMPSLNLPARGLIKDYRVPKATMEVTVVTEHAYVADPKM